MSKFYGINIDTPLSTHHNQPSWQSSTIGQLNQQTEGQVYIREIPRENRQAQFGWRITDAYFVQEDNLLSHFQAFDLAGELVPVARFGINYSTVPHKINSGLFQYPPEFKANYYTPIQPQFPTFEPGGYTVQVMDLVWPSEGLSFGTFKQGDSHQAIYVAFRLFELGVGYPNDTR